MAYDLSKVVVTSSPHIKADDDTRSLMLDVLIALVPALAVAVYTFGARALIHVVIAMVASLVFETIYNKIVHHPNTVGDLSCLVTGVLIAFNIPVAAPLWLSAFGALFGIIVVKMLFGGIGKNFMNPALGARAFMMASWAGFMTTWTAPHANLPLFGNVTVTDAISTATPLATLKTGAVPADTGLLEMLLGQTGGVIGETSALALLAGGVYLLWRKVITINIPAAYIPCCCHHLPVPAVRRCFPRTVDAQPGTVRRPDARRDLHGYRLRYQPGYPEGPDHLRRWLRSADGIHPLLRRSAGGRILLHSDHEHAGLGNRQEDPSAQVRLSA